MNILVATAAWFPDVTGGFSRVARDTAQELAERGHRVVVLAPTQDGTGHVRREGAVIVNRVLQTRSAIPSTVTDVVETWRHGSRYDGSEFDVMMAHGSTVAVGLHAAQPKLPLAVVYHASAVRELRFDRSLAAFGRRKIADYALDPLLSLIERRALKKADGILPLSQYSGSLLRADHPDVLTKVRQVSGGVESDEFSPHGGDAQVRARHGVPDGPPLLLTVRRLEPRMGVDLLLQAVARLPSSLGVNVVIGGDGKLAKPLRHLACDLGLRDRVWFLGYVSEAELRDWYRAADLFVVPSVAYEGFGMVTAEALASGTPVVGTPVGATPELLEPLDPRFVTERADPESLSAGIARALDLLSPELCERSRQYARDTLDWRKVILQWERALVETATAGTLA